MLPLPDSMPDRNTQDQTRYDHTDHTMHDQNLHSDEISDVGDTLRLDDTIGSAATPKLETETETQEKTVIQEPHDPDAVSQMSVEQWLENLRRNDRTFYNMMAMEVWAIAKSMDTLIPGFWSKFMTNRQLAVQNFVVQRRTDKAGLRLEDLGDPNSPPSTESDINQTLP